jgi:hypothetical protein
MCSLNHHSMYYNCSILLLVRAKFDKISFHDEFIDYLPYFLLLCSYVLDHCSYVLVQKRGRGFVSQYFGYDPCLLHHGVRFPCTHDFQLDGSTPALR